MTATRLTLAAAALAAATLVLTGCEPAGAGGGSGAYAGPTCDPNGWGPLSDCGSSDQADRTSASPAPPAGEPPVSESPDRAPAGAPPPPCDGDQSGRDVSSERSGDAGGGSEWAVGDDESCADGSHSEAEHSAPSRSQKITTWQGYTVTVTWIVVSIEVTGFRECVIALRPAHPDPDDHFSRRLTTPKDCEAQRIDAVYRPVDK